jgi:hypothetical protein
MPAICLLLGPIYRLTPVDSWSFYFLITVLLANAYILNCLQIAREMFDEARRKILSAHVNKPLLSQFLHFFGKFFRKTCTILQRIV